METIYKKIANCKKEIKNTKMKKEGKNTFSNYSYFTPTQIEELVSEVCEKNNLITKFDLNRNEFGVFGVLTIIDIDTAEKCEFTMASAIPEIKATNIAQQLGGCVTYTERYLKTSAFGIVDNSLDFDTTENTKKQVETKKETDLSKQIELAKKVLDSASSIENLNFLYGTLEPHLKVQEIINYCKELKAKLTIKN